MTKSIISSLLIAALAACTTPIISAQDAPTMCSCSPTVFTFVLSLNQTCNDNDIEDNSGIDGSFCFTEEGVAVPEPPPPADETDSAADPADSTRDALISDALSSLNIKATATTSGATIEYFGYEEDGPVRKLQSDDPVTEIVSVQFLEFDTSGDLTVINQDDTYADVTLMDGDKLKFNSASSFLDTSLPLSEQMSNPALVPGGASLILYGKTASGVVVRNRFFWMYDMNCGEENSPINVDDEIGWIKVVSLLFFRDILYVYVVVLNGALICVSHFTSFLNTNHIYRMKLQMPGQHSVLPYPRDHPPLHPDQMSPP